MNNSLQLERTPEPWDMVFLRMCQAVALRSKDPSTQCGAVLVSESNVVLSTGFNGPPSQMNDNWIPWGERPTKYAFIIHAEENALWYAVEAHGMEKVKRSTLYCTHHPCSECVLRLIRSGIRTIKIPRNYPPYPMSKYQVDPNQVIARQKLPQLEIALI